MRLLDFIPIKLTLLLILGILIGVKFHIEVPETLIFCGVSLALLGILFSKSTHRINAFFGWVAAILTISIGILTVVINHPRSDAHHYVHHRPEKEALWHLKIIDVLKPSAYSHRYFAEINYRNHFLSSGKVLLTHKIEAEHEAFFVDDELLFFGSLRSIKAPKNPHQFDNQRYMSGLGVYHEVTLKDTLFQLIDAPEITIYGLAARIRKSITQNLQKAGFEGQELAVIQALLLGKRDHIHKTTYDDYKDAGAVHILALSGLHIGILLLLLQFLLLPLEFLLKAKPSN
ncbi:MAG: ComEC/Rec2 family competence protein [Flavobacteriaceae bacterium]